MIVGVLVGLSLAVNVSIDRGGIDRMTGDAGPHYTDMQKNAAVRPLMKSATECIARKVAADPRYPQLSRIGNVTDLIVDSITPCLPAVRALIDAHDEFYGEGSGETFFMGPYLDALPAAVNKLIERIAK
jgi:formate hydrogenlyase subunit 3/multisubunit Na+/H+ antiporter MnhD subunit